MKKILFAVLISGSALMIASCGENKTSTETTSTETDSKEVAEDMNEKKLDSTNKDLKGDADWAVNVADMGMMGLHQSETAVTKASSSKVKDFAQLMVKDHTQMNGELSAAAKSKNITLPAAMSDKCQKMCDDLNAKTGNDFDKAYMENMIDVHEDAISSFKKQASDGVDADLKKWASDKLSALQQHLDQAKLIKDGIK